MGKSKLSKASNVWYYILTKLTGAGFLLFVMSLYVFLINNNLYDFSETLQEPFLWFIVFIYGIFSSVVIDFLVAKTKGGLLRKVIFYSFAGFIIFLIQGFNIFTVIAGAVGSISALIFFYGTTIPKKSTIMSITLAIVVPVIIFILSLIDFTEKQEWKEQREADMFTVSFEYFNGRHEIPVELEKGEVIDISRSFNVYNGGGYGFYVKNDANEYVGLTEMPDDVLRLKSTYDGIYNIVITGDRLKGKIAVNWEYVRAID